MMQHVNVKVFVRRPDEVDLEAALPVFHRWIREAACEELLIDVADYRHVPAGPGVILIGHEANYSLDNRGNRLGLLYNRKAPFDGAAGDHIAQALRAALAASRRLEDEPEFDGKLRFNGGELEIAINDRLLARNTDEDFVALRTSLEWALAGFYGPEKLQIERIGEARERLRIGVAAERFIPVSSLLHTLTAVS